MKLVSIVIPCFNYGHLIDQTINSIIHQTYYNWEIIVVDDGSTDNTQQVIEKLQVSDQRIRYFKIKNSGPSKARNIGITMAKGDYLMFIDSDDLLSKRKLESHIKHFSTNSNIDISYSDAFYFEHNFPDKMYLRSSLINKPWIPRILNKSGFDILSFLLTKNIMPICSPLFKIDVIKKVGYLDEEYDYMEDWDYFVRAAFLNFCFSFLQDNDNTAVLIRVQKNSLSKNSKKMLLHEIKLRNKYQEILKSGNNIYLSSTNIINLISINDLGINRSCIRIGNIKGIVGVFKNKDFTFIIKCKICFFDVLRFLKSKILNH